ncbi:heavy metal-associated isoprenylated plant protein 33 isoform X1 [Apis mellifera]|uniref:Heavy metal-associated isoprenylated plant protein 33 isoform X1 n=1 Tax=Apis mellifera TaxID=7460 RepID=A0A7M7IHS1_APIME|nr:heavy metal-associated isoprenylated plant protein 33 isoform X1 [Apis mellifera]|eukprot:XP_016769932.1 heavy metal-associated isoprenylated plant protein 33 isoform X1 [Apis mellifera]
MVSETARSFRALLLLLFVGALSAAPIIEDAENTTLSTELKPPPYPQKEDEHYYMLFVINLFGVKNVSGETSDEIFENDVLHHVPQLTDPLATLLLVIDIDENDEDTDKVVDLDELADELGNEDFNVEKINYGGETKLLRLKLSKEEGEGIFPSKSKLEKLKKIRNKRTLCVKCGGSGGLGGHSRVDAIPVIIIPVAGGYPSGGGGYPSGGGGYPSGGGGYPSGGGGYPSGSGGYPSGGGGHPSGGGGGCSTCGGSSYASASANANAQAGSGKWGYI